MRTISALLLVAFTALPAHAHFNMLMPQTASAKKGENVVFIYQWGHPYEHELFDAPAPDSVQVLDPDGKTITDLTKALEKISLPAGVCKKVAAYQFHFTPEQRGDYVFLLRTPPIWMETDGEFLQDNVKVVLHVQAQKGWDGAFRTEFELTPLTRPYGLEPGMVFQAALAGPYALEPGMALQAIVAGGIPVKPVAGALVEIEPYHAAPPKNIPADEYATRAAKTGPDGGVTATLTDPGWWCLAAMGAGGMKEHDGKSYPVKRRSIFWVHVDEKTADK
jgi:cobalt/nickel transport protein